MTGPLRRILTEPLVQFALIGVALFAVDRATQPETVDPRTIRVDAEVHRRLADIFEESRDRLPTPLEMDTLVERFLMNETLFREALALRLDDGDEMIRERLMQRMRLMMYSGIEVEAPSDEVLRAWYAERTEEYAELESLSVQILGIDGTEEEARAQAAAANERQARGAVIKPAGVPLVNFRERPRLQLVSIFGEEFVRAIEAAPVEKWTAVPSPRGWQVVQLRGRTPARAPAFEEIRQRLEDDWRRDELHRRAREDLAALRARYPVVREPCGPDVVKTDAAAAGAPAAPDAGVARAETAAGPAEAAE